MTNDTSAPFSTEMSFVQTAPLPQMGKHKRQEEVQQQDKSSYKEFAQASNSVETSLSNEKICATVCKRPYGSRAKSAFWPVTVHATKYKANR